MITVIAGVNGSGKSSIIGSSLRACGAEYFNPDEKAQELLSEDPQISTAEANGLAWKTGIEMLSRAIEDGSDYVFETTLGGNSIPEKLHEAADKGQGLNIIFCGLSSPEKHLERVASRVANGGHNIPEEKIRDRWIKSISNMAILIPRCNGIKVYDNSNDLIDGKPNPILLFSMHNGTFKNGPIENMPSWAKPLATAAIEKHMLN